MTSVMDDPKKDPFITEQPIISFKLGKYLWRAGHFGTVVVDLINTGNDGWVRVAWRTDTGHFAASNVLLKDLIPIPTPFDDELESE